MKALKFVSISVLLFALLFNCSKKMTEDELYKLAQEQYGSEQYQEAITTFTEIVESYPEGKKHAEAMFMLGFINANDLKNFDEAEARYKAFLEKYPNHDLSDDAEYEIKTLGKDINELPIFQKMATDSLEE
jgi:TolA-binding protein